MLERIARKDFTVGLIGLGYVGLPLALEFVENGIKVVGFELDARKCELLKAGKSYIKHIPTERIAQAAATGLLDATTAFERLPEVDAILIAVPTPLNKYREPDLGPVIAATETIGRYLRKGQLVVLESTTYPGTVDEVMRPILEQASGLSAEKDFWLAFSPEREDPNNETYNTRTIPKVVGGLTPEASAIAKAVYDHVIVQTVMVSSTRAAEATKLLENIYRAVNIAMINELKMVFTRMGIDIWEVIEAAKTKPFGFQAFYPGPGLGGHCIPIDPFYLTWKAREFEMTTRFIELAGEINTGMPRYVTNRLMHELNRHEKSLKGSCILLLGMAYKKNIDDMRESPSIKLVEQLVNRGAKLDYHDPYIPVYHDEHGADIHLSSVPLSAEMLATYDAVLISTDHDDVDYAFVVKHSRLVLDTRNATKHVKEGREKIAKA
ncbi:MAG: nucleotide sugar dehydrogenase [bacterium]|nr:nucleotide sugar dehydrogenase [bacterium]